MSNEAVLILPTQLFEQHPLLATQSKIILVEFERYFSAFNFHKQKLILHRATMQMYREYLEKVGHTVIYVEHAKIDELEKKLKTHNISFVHCCDPTDTPFEKELQKICRSNKIELKIYETPLFLTPRDWIEKTFSGKESFRQHTFYQAQRKRMNVLMTKQGTPTGGKWSFDEENRKPLPKNLSIPKAYTPRENEFVIEARAYIEKHFPDNYGNDAPFSYPTTFSTAKASLDDFLAHRLANFGPYQDAIAQDEHILFHSILTPMLNIGLLTPAYVLKKTLDYAAKHKTPLASLEGFIRQLIGWREYIRAVYITSGETERKSNFFNHTKKLPASFWTAQTNIQPVDDAINTALKTAYAHHIIRLMILGNFMLLCEFSPGDIYKWFMELFIDAYDWVMVPNVYGMSQYADGGLMSTKPYISGSNYILKMSDYKKGDWSSIWDALYWHFILRKQKTIVKNQRLAVMNMYLKRMKPEVLEKHIQTAQLFLKRLHDKKQDN